MLSAFYFCKISSSFIPRHKLFTHPPPLLLLYYRRMVTIFNITIPLVWFHLTSLTFVIFFVVLSDEQAIKWMRGNVSVLEKNKIMKLHQLVNIGLLLMITTGFVMFLPFREYLLTHLPFQIKMGFVLTLLINSLFIGRLLKVATEKKYSELTQKERTPLLISGVVSLIGWSGAIFAAISMNI